MNQPTIAQLHLRRFYLRRHAILCPPVDAEEHQQQLAALDAQILAAHAERATCAVAY